MMLILILILSGIDALQSNTFKANLTDIEVLADKASQSSSRKLGDLGNNCTLYLLIH